MQIKYDSQLMEDIVIRGIEQQKTNGDAIFYQKFHKSAEPIYELPIEHQEEKFGELYSGFFYRLGKDKAVKETMDEFLYFDNKVNEIVFKKGILDEISFLDSNRDSIVIKVHPDRFLETSGLKEYLRHEFMHIKDMLDENFGYYYKNLNSIKENLIRGRYGLIWDIYIDSRLIRAGREPIMDKDARYQEFEMVYRGIPSSIKSDIFERLWNREKMTHSEIMGMAEETDKLVKLIDSEEKFNKFFLPGSPCPLCGFPTYNWENDLGERLSEELVEFIKEDYPDWLPEKGSCNRCVEIYEVRYAENGKTC